MLNMHFPQDYTNMKMVRAECQATKSSNLVSLRVGEIRTGQNPSKAPQ